MGNMGKLIVVESLGDNYGKTKYMIESQQTGLNYYFYIAEGI